MVDAALILWDRIYLLGDTHTYTQTKQKNEKKKKHAPTQAFEGEVFHAQSTLILHAESFKQMHGCVRSRH